MSEQATMNLHNRSPDALLAYLHGYTAGVRAAAATARQMADHIGLDPVTDGGRLMRDVCLDVADSIDDLDTSECGA